MDAHYSIAYSSRDNNQISDDDPHIPIRVFLLSDHRLLRDALARSLGSQADISLVGAQESSLSITAEMIESTCDVLLVDPSTQRNWILTSSTAYRTRSQT